MEEMINFNYGPLLCQGIIYNEKRGNIHMLCSKWTRRKASDKGTVKEMISEVYLRTLYSSNDEDSFLTQEKTSTQLQIVN